MSGSKKTLVLSYLLTGDTISGAAEKAKVSERQVYRWLEDETFLQELHHQEKIILNACSWRLTAEVKNSIDALVDVREVPAVEGNGYRLKAASAIIELSLKYLNMLTFEDRLTRLEGKAFNVENK